MNFYCGKESFFLHKDFFFPLQDVGSQASVKQKEKEMSRIAEFAFYKSEFSSFEHVILIPCRISLIFPTLSLLE